LRKSLGESKSSSALGSEVPGKVKETDPLSTSFCEGLEIQLGAQVEEMGTPNGIKRLGTPGTVTEREDDMMAMAERKLQ
jgi:hypothetical protein